MKGLRALARVGALARLLVLASPLAACEGGGRAPSSPPTGRGGIDSMPALEGISESRRSHRPGDAAARVYGGPRALRLNPAETQILRLIGAEGAHDPALSAMVRELARATPSRTDMPPELVDGLLAWYGLGDPPPQVLVVELEEDPDDCAHRVSAPCVEPYSALAESARALLRTPGNWRLGVGTEVADNGRTRLIVGAVDRSFALEALPVEVAAGASVSLRGRVLGARRDPEVHLVDAGGSWRKLKLVRGDDGSIAAPVNCAGARGQYRLEVFAVGSHGPEVLANLPIWCGVRRPREIHFTVERVAPGVSPETIARRNFDYLNDARQRAGLSALRWDEGAAKIALAHSRDMVEAGFVGHVSPTTGDASDRMRGAGLEAAVVRENIARGYGPKSVHLSLMSSPGHRANILGEDVTHVGIGVVYGAREGTDPSSPRPIFVTQQFYAPAGGDLPADPMQALGQRVDARLRALGLPAIDWDPRLSAIAAEHARARLRRRREVDPEATRQEIFALGYGSVRTFEVESASFAALVELSLWTQLQGRRVGRGVARAPDGSGLLLVVYSAR